MIAFLVSWFALFVLEFKKLNSKTAYIEKIVYIAKLNIYFYLYPA